MVKELFPGRNDNIFKFKSILEENMNLIPVCSDDTGHVKFLYQLLLERPAYANISHRDMPTFNQHVAFVKNNPYQLWFLVADDIERNMACFIGSIYLTRQNEIGIFVDRKWQGKGYGKRMLDMAENVAPCGRILANIAPGNERSIRLFEKAGYRKIQQTYEKVIE